MNKPAIKYLFISFFFVSLFCPLAKAQDSTALMKELMEVCSSYKQLPLQVEVNVKKISNIITAPVDSGSITAHFYLEEHGSYVSYGQIEQLVNDSLFLIVNKAAERMILFPAIATVANQVKLTATALLADSSIERMEHQFSIKVDHVGQPEKSLLLLGRRLLYNTDLPVEALKITYDLGAKRLISVLQIQRTLVPVDSVTYAQAMKDESFNGRRFCVEGEGCYLVRERITEYEYLSVTHDKERPLPVTLKNRIVRKSDDGYAPVAPYDGFIITRF